MISRQHNMETGEKESEKMKNSNKLSSQSSDTMKRKMKKT